MTDQRFTVALVGAGPASLYAAEVLAKAGHEILILNRDIKPGGLAEFGIYPTKLKMKTGLRKYFRRVLEMPNVHYMGHVQVGREGHVTLEELRGLGAQAVVVAVGAQGTKWLGLEGESHPSVIHAKDLVYHYNALPPFSERPFAIGEHVCVVGLGNVCLDIVHWLVCERQVQTVTAVARRGPAERAYTDKEFETVAAALDRAQLQAEFDAIGPMLREVGQDADALLAELVAAAEEPLEKASPTRFQLRYLRSPAGVCIEDGRLRGLVCEKTRLVRRAADAPVAMEATGEQEVLACDTVVFAIGDSIEPSLGLALDPGSSARFATVPEPWARHPERPRYMAWDPELGAPVWDTFLVGWARRASDGLVGKARADAVQGCEEILAFLNGQFDRAPRSGRPAPEVLAELQALLASRGARPVAWTDVLRLLAVEAERAKEMGVPEFRFAQTRDMLQAMGFGPEAL